MHFFAYIYQGLGELERQIVLSDERARAYFILQVSHTWSVIDAGTSAVVVAPGNSKVISSLFLKYIIFSQPDTARLKSDTVPEYFKGPIL